MIGGFNDLRTGVDQHGSLHRIVLHIGHGYGHDRAPGGVGDALLHLLALEHVQHVLEGKILGGGGSGLAGLRGGAGYLLVQLGLYGGGKSGLQRRADFRGQGRGQETGPHEGHHHGQQAAQGEDEALGGAPPEEEEQDGQYDDVVNKIGHKTSKKVKSEESLGAWKTGADLPPSEQSAAGRRPYRAKDNRRFSRLL